MEESRENVPSFAMVTPYSRSFGRLSDFRMTFFRAIGRFWVMELPARSPPS